MNSVVTARSVLSISCMQSSEIFVEARASRITFTIALLELMASLPPFNITAFPALKHSENASRVTLGLDSYIIPITPSGTLF